MDALDVLKVCLRRWYVVLPVVIISVAAGLGLALQQRPTYYAFGTYALVYHTSVPGARDPLLDNPLAASGALVLGEALVADFMSPASQVAYGGVGHSGTAPGEPTDDTSYSVSLPDKEYPVNSQLYLFETWGKDPDGLRAVVDSVLKAAPMHAAQIQNRAGAPKRSQFTAFVTGPTRLVMLPSTSKLKLVVAMLGVGILAGSALSLIVDRASWSRPRGRPRREPQPRTRSVEHSYVSQNPYDSPGILAVPTSRDAPAQRSGGEPRSVTPQAATSEPEADIELEGPTVSEDRAEAVTVIDHTEAKRLPELDATPFSERLEEPDSGGHVDHKSILENDLWPLLEYKEEFEAEGPVDSQFRDRQPAS
jgi:hypothetical protein